MSEQPSAARPSPTLPKVPRLAWGLHRLAGPLMMVAMPVLLLALVVGFTPLGELVPGDALSLLAPVMPVAIVLFAIGFVSSWIPRPRIEGVVALRAPVVGRWIAMNSPADRVPSHGTHQYGQTYAIDLVHDPEPGARPAFGSGAGMRPPTDFPAFGAPVVAPADATVVRVRHGARDHRSRTTWLAIAYLLVEGMLRDLTGVGRIFGNHVLLRLDTGGYVAIAHLQHGSVEVAEGERVVAGQRIAACGNSGNSSEPHVHLQVMDHPRATIAVGLPFTFTDVVSEDADASEPDRGDDAAPTASTGAEGEQGERDSGGEVGHVPANEAPFIAGLR